MSNEAISLIPSGKLRCVVSGKLRKDTPEENVRQRIARSLLDNYGYDKVDIEIEFTINQGSKKQRVDIAIFPPNTEHKQENIKIIVECKREEIKPTDKDNGIEQLKSYISACLNAKYGMWVGSELQVWEKITDKNQYKLETATDIPRFGLEAPQPLTFAELVPAQDELINVFKRCHNYIYGNQGFQKEQAFDELLKIIFCKVYDEDTTIDTMRFFIGNQERRSEISQRQLKQTIEKIFEEVKIRYPYIFDKEESIRLENRVLAYLVGEMQRFSFLLTEADVKGIAYVVPPLITSVSANWLYDGDYRLDACFYGSNAQTAKRIITESIYPVETLGDITQDIFILGRFKRIYASDKQAGYPYLGASEALQFRPTSDRYLAKDHLPKHSQKHFVKKDWILMSCSGTVGRAVISTERLEKFFLTHDLIRIIPKKFPLVGYLYAFLSSWIGQALVTKDRYGSAIQHLESHHIASVPVPILPESEQELIHNEILHVYQLREKANQLLDEANELLHQELGLPYFDEGLVPYLPQPPYQPSHRPKMLPVKSFTTKLSELGDRFDSSFHVPVAKTAIKLLLKAKYPVTLLENLAEDIFIPFRFKRIYVTKKYGSPFLLPSQITQIKFWEKKYLSKSANKKSIESCELKDGWLVISRSGTIGKTLYISHYLNNWIGSDDLLRLIPDHKKCHSGFLYSFLDSPYGQLQMNAAVYGAVIGHLEEHHLKDVFIPEPPLDIQKEIGDKVVKAFEYKEQANLLEEQTINKLEQILEQD